MSAPFRKVQADVDRDDEEGRHIDKGYTWESIKGRSWDQIVEDPTTGRLQAFDRREQIARKRRRDDGVRGVRRGIIRYTVLVIDTSAAMDATDLKPSRSDAVCAACGEFVREYFDQNPISQMAVLITRDSVAQNLSGLSSNPNQHVDAVREALALGTCGDASLQHVLDKARTLLAPIPSYAIREVVIAYGSLSTCDPGNIHNSIAAAAKAKMRCSAVGLGAELHIMRALSNQTGGTYSVAMNEDHFAELLGSHVVPPPTTTQLVSASLIRMGFPILKRVQQAKPSLNNPGIKTRIGYECPRCSAWLSEVPCECVLCGLMLVSSPHLARSYHHLFPVARFEAIETGPRGDLDAKETTTNGHGDTLLANDSSSRCTGCQKFLSRGASLQTRCPKCQNVFCIDCDVFLHESLHHCPGCGDHAALVLAERAT